MSENLTALDELRKKGVEIDPSDHRSPEVILEFLQELEIARQYVQIDPSSEA